MTQDDSHPPVDVLSELQAGILDPATAAAAEGHLRRCPSCAHAASRLVAVSAALRELPAEVPMPPAVAARLDAALTAERRSTATSPVRGDVQAGPVAWFRRRAPRALAAAASVAVVGLAGYVVATNAPGSGDEQSSAEVDVDSGGGVAQPHAAQDDALMSEPRIAELATAALMERIDQVSRTREQVSSGCGQELADEVGQALIGSATLPDGVLVVLQDTANTLTGWTLPSCAALSGDAVRPPVTAGNQATR